MSETEDFVGDYVLERLAGEQAAAVVGDEVEAALVDVGADHRHVRGDEHVGKPPDPVIRRQRFTLGL
ncbi:hypothetical protein [Candidatus Poriferisodalis sp.]|uniref:hypothetical protein n=1 Tax=Candidatus Poriferisodalis sp. TaxID=3101277 RepID=UPI003B5C4248